MRVIEDYTSNAGAQRRKDYLNAAAELIVDDLEAVVSAWATTASNNCAADATGCYRSALLGELSGSDASKNISADQALKTIMGGMGVFIKSELANERIAVAVLTPSEEDEHSCFSDNTHRDIALNYKGFVDVLKAGGDTSMYALSDAATKAKIDTLIASIDDKVATVNRVANTTEHFDYQIKEGSNTRQTIIDMKNEMRTLGDIMVEVAKSFGIDLSAEDVTDPEETQV
jgi:putative iron-regulated protein